MKSTISFLGATVLAAALFGADSAVAQPPTTTSSGSSVSVSTVNGESVVTLNGKQIYKGPTSGAVSSRSSNVNGVEFCAVYDGNKLLWESSPGGAQQIGSAAATGGAGSAQNQFAQPHQQALEQLMEMQRQMMQAHGGGSFGPNFSLPGGGTLGHGGAPGFSGSSSHSFGGGSSGGPGSIITGSQTNYGPQTFPIPVSPNAMAGISIKTVNGSTVVVYNGQEVSVGPTRGKVVAKSTSFNDQDYAAAFDDDRVVWENIPGAAAHLK